MKRFLRGTEQTTTHSSFEGKISNGLPARWYLSSASVGQISEISEGVISLSLSWLRCTNLFSLPLISALKSLM